MGLIRGRSGAVDSAQNAAQGHNAQENGKKNVEEKKGVSGHGGIQEKIVIIIPLRGRFL